MGPPAQSFLFLCLALSRLPLAFLLRKGRKCAPAHPQSGGLHGAALPALPARGAKPSRRAKHKRARSKKASASRLGARFSGLFASCGTAQDEYYVLATRKAGNWGGWQIEAWFVPGAQVGAGLGTAGGGHPPELSLPCPLSCPTLSPGCQQSRPRISERL